MLKIMLVLLTVLVFSSCGGSQPKPEHPGSEETFSSDLEKIESCFAEVKMILAKDQGSFWNRDLYGPLLFVNPENRVFYSNENNLNEDFQKAGSIYTGTLPEKYNIANTAFDWNGKRWSMVMLPLPEKSADRNNLVIHELFHAIQPAIGFASLSEKNNSHLDTEEGRLFLKLELEALKKALSTAINQEQVSHLENALVFRLMRYTSPQIKEAENSLEINEGLAEYTGSMLSGRTNEEMIIHYIEKIKQFYEQSTFVRSFAYQTVPVYGFLLSKKNNNWHREINKETNLTDYFMNKFDLKIPAELMEHYTSVRGVYNYKIIAEEEKNRERKRLVRIDKFKTKFLKKPTLEIPFENMNISFDPTNIVPLEEYGTIYPNLRVTDNWGVLLVENDALLSADWSSVLVSEPVEITNAGARGVGWSLTLNTGFSVVNKNGKYELIRQK